MPAFVLENFVAVQQVQVVQFVQLNLELAQTRIQQLTVRFEAVDVVFRWKVTLPQTFIRHDTITIKLNLRLKN